MNSTMEPSLASGRGRGARIEALKKTMEPVNSAGKGGASRPVESDVVSQMAAKIKENALNRVGNCVDEATAIYMLEQTGREEVSRMTRELCRENNGLLDRETVDRAKREGRLAPWMSTVFDRAIKKNSEPSFENSDICDLIAISTRLLLYKQGILQLPALCVQLLREGRLNQNEAIVLMGLAGTGTELEKKQRQFAREMAAARSKGTPMSSEDIAGRLRKYGKRLPKRPDQREAAEEARFVVDPLLSGHDPAQAVRMALRAATPSLGTAEEHLAAAVRWSERMDEEARLSYLQEHVLPGLQELEGYWAGVQEQIDCLRELAGAQPE